MQSSVTGERLRYLTERLTAKNKLRHCMFLLAFLLVPLAIVKGIERMVEMLLLICLLVLILRNIDPVFSKYLKISATNDPTGTVPFVLPGALFFTTGALVDSVSVLDLIVFGGDDINFNALSLLVLTLAAKVTAAKTLIHSARVVLDPTYRPFNRVVQTTGISHTLDRVEFSQVQVPLNSNSSV